MNKTDALMLPVMTSADHHTAAAEQHAEAAESHRNAAAHYVYGDFQQASEYAKLAENYGNEAQQSCKRAME